MFYDFQVSVQRLTKCWSRSSVYLSSVELPKLLPSLLSSCSSLFLSPWFCWSPDSWNYWKAKFIFVILNPYGCTAGKVKKLKLIFFAFNVSFNSTVLCDNCSDYIFFNYDFNLKSNICSLLLYHQDNTKYLTINSAITQIIFGVILHWIW